MNTAVAERKSQELAHTGEVVSLLQVISAARGETAVGAAETTVAVLFQSALEDADYVPLLVPSWNANLAVSGLAATGFTIVASAAPGGAGGTVRWVIVR